ncbi:MAG: triose-phosphate isomerase family protein [Propionibacteriaceae bacterium]
MGTSWKMNKTRAQAAAYLDVLVDGLAAAGAGPGPDPIVFVIPPLTALTTVADRLPAGSPIIIGAQNAHWESDGAWTGEVSMEMIKDAGAQLLEIGHAERRAWFGEADATVAAKVAAALTADLVPLVCVGEPAEVRDAGAEQAFVGDQVRAALSTTAEVERVVIAYEPVWAIGEHGRAAAPAEIAPVLATIRSTITELSDGGRPRAVLYGGSVDHDNAGAFLDDPSTDGLFVGRAAWQPADFLDLIALCRDHPATTRVG